MLLPAIAQAADCRIEHRQGSWLSYLEDCPKDASQLVLRHSICVYALDTFKDTRTSEKIKTETQEVMLHRRCDDLPCDKKKIFAKYQDTPEMVTLMQEAFTQMNAMYHADMNASTFDMACAD